MRLWHQALIPYLPDVKTSGGRRKNQLGGQHRECCALRGGFWGHDHSTVNYVWQYPYEWLVAYHWLVITELERRGYDICRSWDEPSYRGKSCNSCEVDRDRLCEAWQAAMRRKEMLYPEHNDDYHYECIENLQAKGIEI